MSILITNRPGTASSGLNVTANQTTTYAILTTDGVINYDTSGGGFTTTLPTAVGVSGKIYYLKLVNAGTTTLGVLTVATTGGQTIDGAAGTTLNTTNEELTLLSNGTNWEILNRTIDEAWVSWTPTFNGFGTVSAVSAMSRRVGSSLEVRVNFTSGTSTGAEARVSLGLNGTDGNVTTLSTLPTISKAGDFIYNVAVATYPVILCEASVTYLTFGLQDVTRAGTTKQLGNAVAASGNAISLQASVPINGWKGI